MRYALAVVLLLLTAACGDSPTAPSSPPALPSARLVMEGGSTWQNCLLGNCSFRAELRNTGPGCATGVRGVTRFYDATDAVLGAGLNWGLTDGTIVRPGEVFAYSIFPVSIDVANKAKTYVTEPAWTDVRCP